MAQHHQSVLGFVFFQFAYKSERRKHSHRCRACWKIINEGDEVFCLSHGRSSWMLHVSCKDEPHTFESTWLDAFRSWAIGKLIMRGYSEKKLMELHPVEFAIYKKMSSSPNRIKLVGYGYDEAKELS